MITSQAIRNYSRTAESRAKDGKVRELPHRKYYDRIAKQSKKLSQLIVSSWGDDDNAKKIREIFLNFINTDPQGEAYAKMRQLLTGKSGLFGKVFEEEEIDDYLIQVDWSAFEGSIGESKQPSEDQKPPYFILTLPYPPKPHDFNLDMQDEALQSWLNEEVHINIPGEVTNPFPPVPYLPQTTT